MPSATQQIGNYRLVKHLGDGGQAAVYLGEHLFLKRLSAVKILHTSLTGQDCEAFLTEAQILARLTHPHIIRVHDYTVEQGTPLLIMDYAPGGTLRTLCPSGQRLPLDMLLVYLRQIAAALQYAHENNVIHRDIKPENLLLDEQQQIKLSDFGLALFAPSLEQLKTQDLVGTVFYMAPEQLRGKPCFASDQYALAVLLFEWLCGEHPFSGTPAQIIGQHLTAEMPSLHQKRPDLPREVDDVLRRAFAKAPESRFKNMLEFAQAFESACHADLSKLPGRQPESSSPVSSPPDFYSTQVFASGSSLIQRQQPQQQMFANPQQQRQEDANRHRMLARVRLFWIDGVLEQSLRDVVHLVLGLREKPEAVNHPWKLVLQQADTARRAIPSNATITEVYDMAGGELLILGDPGSGKTTLLLELTRDLLKRAEDGQLDLLPVVFNLFSWSETRRPLQEWMIDELIHKYRIPRKLARSWVVNEQILPLLDGLDEVAPTMQSACVEAINAYRRDHGLLPLVICCRKDDYISQKHLIQINVSVEVQPLTSSQIDGYLSGLGPQLEVVRTALARDQELQELVSTPLMLNVLAIAYQDQSLVDLLHTDKLDLRQRQLFEMYVKRMLERRGSRTPYTPEQTTRWLSWLAKGMRQHNQTIFYVERLQPDWLPMQRLQRFYRRWAVRFPGMLMGGLIGAWIGGLFVLGRLSTGDGGFLTLSQATFESCILGLFLGFLFTGRPPVERSRSIAWRDHLRNGAVLGVCGTLPIWSILLLAATLGMGGQIDWSYIALDLGLGWLSYFLVGSLASLLIKRIQHRGEDTREGRWSLRRLRQNLISSGYLQNALVCAALGLIYGFVSMLSIGNLFGTDANGVSMFAYVFAQMLSFGSSFGIVGLLASIFVQHAGTEDIQPVEKITWSWRSLARSFLRPKHFIYAAMVGLFYGLLYGLLELIFGVESFGFGVVAVLSVFGIVALVGWLLLALFGGWSGGTVEASTLTAPNEGIRRSALNGLLFGLLSWLIYGGITWLVRFLASFTPLTQFILPDTWLNSWFLYGLPGALVIGLLVGGWACLKHAILRRQLRKIDALPGRYPDFLDYATERILLRKAGGGYLFIHRLLLDYFASLEDSEPDGHK